MPFKLFSFFSFLSSIFIVLVIVLLNDFEMTVQMSSKETWIFLVILLA